jgi:hypothetical protein
VQLHTKLRMMVIINGLEGKDLTKVITKRLMRSVMFCSLFRYTNRRDVEMNFVKTKPADCLVNVRASMSHNLIGLHGLLQG